MESVTKQDLRIYKYVSEYSKKGLVSSFDDEIINMLSNNRDSKDKTMINYLYSLNLGNSVNNKELYIRYLSLFMNKPFFVYKGKLNNLDNGNFSHTWIETNDEIYDTYFLGKWSKNIYYELFNPIDIKKVDLNKDNLFLNCKKNNKYCFNTSPLKLLKYVDWYKYLNNKNNKVIPTSFFPNEEFELKKAKFMEGIIDLWNKTNNSNDDYFPSELLSFELMEYIEKSNFLNNSFSLYKELIKFISENKEIYEKRKNIPNDIELWNIALKDKYSDSFKILICDMNKIIYAINKNKEQEK